MEVSISLISSIFEFLIKIKIEGGPFLKIPDLFASENSTIQIIYTT